MIKLFSSICTIALVLVCILILSGCATPAEDARTLLDRLEFEDDEYGSFELEGTLDLNPLPFFSSQVHMKLEKTKPAPAVPVQP